MLKITRLLRRFYHRWNSSLSVRIITTTVVMTVLIAVLGGMLIMNLITDGVLEGKRQASHVEAATALDRMQNQLDESDLSAASLYERLGQLAVEVGGESNQYGVIIDAGPSVYLSKAMQASSVPDSLREAVGSADNGLWSTPTTLHYQDGSLQVGLAVGGNLQAPSGQSIPVYFLFPLDSEVQIIEVVRRVLLSVGVVLIIALVAVVWIMARRVTVPVRQARDVALRIADGDLNERLSISGDDELADLARSMNSMASTLQTQIGALEDLSQVQQQFVSDVSHELRTPLTTMRMAVDLLYESREDLNSTNRRTIELLYSEIGRFEEMLSDLLEISRYDAGAVRLEAEYSDVAELAAGQITAIMPLANQMKTAISFETTGDCVAECDPRRIRRIITNLLSNAIEHAEGRQVTLSCAGDEKSVALTVRDHGVGFEARQSELVFHRFWRADPSRTRVVGGTGLGLAISREDAQLHNGWLEAWGRPGQGAQFRLTLPRNQDISLTQSALPLVPKDWNSNG